MDYSIIRTPNVLFNQLYKRVTVGTYCPTLVISSEITLITRTSALYILIRP